MIYRKTLITVGLLLFGVILICFFSTPKDKFLFTDTNAISPPQIILDAGHGGLINTTKQV